jgi:hypothetical protein
VGAEVTKVGLGKYSEKCVVQELYGGILCDFEDDHLRNMSMTIPNHPDSMDLLPSHIGS